MNLQGLIAHDKSQPATGSAHTPSTYPYLPRNITCSLRKSAKIHATQFIDVLRAYEKRRIRVWNPNAQLLQPYVRKNCWM